MQAVSLVARPDDERRHIELRERLGLAPRPEGETAILIVVRLRGEVVSLLVDTIGDVVTVDEDTFEAPPDTLDDAGRELLRGGDKMNDRLLLALATDRAVAA